MRKAKEHKPYLGKKGHMLKADDEGKFVYFPVLGIGYREVHVSIPLRSNKGYPTIEWKMKES
jgi:hypothetical protein